MASGGSIANTGDYEIISNNGNVLLTATGDVQLATVNGGTGTVYVIADLDDDGAGAISDVLAAETANITAASASLRAGSGIGSGNALETAISTLAASNTTSGDIEITNNVGGLLTIGTVNGLAGVTNSAAAAGMVVVVNNSPLTVASNVMAVGNITITASDTAVANMTDNLTVNAGVSVTSTTGSIALNAGDDLTLTATSVVSAAAGGVMINIDAPGSDPDNGPNDPLGGSTVTLGDASVLVAANGTMITGGDDPDTFNIIPQTASTISLDGGGPTTFPGDVLLYDGSGTKTITGVNSGWISAAGVLDVAFTDIELVGATAGGKLDDVLDLSDPGLVALGSMDGMPNEVIVRIDAATGTQLEILFDGDTTAGPAASIISRQLLANVNSLTILGSTDDDFLQIAETAGGLPAFSGSAPTGHANESFTASTLMPTNVGLHFDGGTGTNSLGLLLLPTSGHDVAYFSDDDFAANSGNVNVSGQFSMSFVNLAPIDFVGGGGGSTLTIDTTATPATSFLTVDDDVNVPAPFLPFAAPFGAAAADDGVTAVWGDGGFETTRFGNFGTVIIRGGTGAESITLNTLDMGVVGPLDPLLPGPNPITAITLDGDNTAGTDTAADTINVLPPLPAASRQRQRRSRERHRQHLLGRPHQRR